MVDNNTQNTVPPGITLRHPLQGHTGVIRWVSWSPDGLLIASGSEDHSIRIWEAQTGQLISILRAYSETCKERM
jgi:WD40 repeat protein